MTKNQRVFDSKEFYIVIQFLNLFHKINCKKKFKLFMLHINLSYILKKKIETFNKS